MPQDPIENVFANLLATRRVSNQLAREVDEVIRELLAEVAAELARIDPTGVGPSRFRLDRVDKLMERVRDLAGGAFRDIERTMRRHLTDLGAIQGQRAARQLGEMLEGLPRFTPAGPSRERIAALVRTQPFGDPQRGAQTLRQWARQQNQTFLRRVDMQVRMGVLRDEPLGGTWRGRGEPVAIRRTQEPSIVDRLLGRRQGLGRTGGVLAATERDAEALARTAVNHYSNEAYLETYRQNERVTREWQFVATMDARTSFVCARYDGETFSYDDPAAPVPPLHFNCRSVVSPVILWEELGMEPPAEGTRFARAFGVEDGAAKVVGSQQVRRSVDFEGWLGRQSKTFQNEWLGPSRAELWRDGKVTLRDLVRDDGRVLTLEQLAAR